MEKFAKETDAIRNVLDWAHRNLADTDASFAVGTPSASPENLSAAGARLAAVEDKLSAVRKRMRRIAGENKEFKRDHGNRTAALRSRVVQYKQLGERFIDETRTLEAVRIKHRDALARSLKSDVMAIAPGTSEAQIDAALDGNTDRGVDSVMQYAVSADEEQLRYHVQDIRERNAEIHKLTVSMQELNAMFTDMSILVDNQQDLLNTIEYNVLEVKGDTEKAVEELVIARKHQKAKNKKKIWCVIIIILIVIAAAVAILIPLAKKFNWFSSSTRIALQPADTFSPVDLHTRIHVSVASKVHDNHLGSR
jgi:syntaxin 1B/2/3